MVTYSNESFTVRQSSIYRNLPTFPNVAGLTAIVPGATGISGWNTIRSLLDSPTRWTKIYAMSRSLPGKELMNLLSAEQQSRVQHLAVDFSGKPQDVAESLSAVREPNPYVFFYAYIQPKTEGDEKVWGNVEKLNEVNTALFASFLEALEIAEITPKRILLQTGGKHYGMQLGRAAQPLVESDPEPRHLGPNFYYPQQDSLFAFCTRHPQTSWNVVRPCGVFGSALKAQMSGLYLLSVYAAVQAHKQEPLYFPGDWNAWQGPTPVSTARLTGYLSEWAVLNDGCANQAFNALDSNSLTFQRLFAELARWYGNDAGAVGPPSDESKFSITKMAGGKDCPLGHGPPLISRSSFKILDWAQRQENQDAWKEIMTASGGKISSNPFEGHAVKDNFQLLDIYFSMVALSSMNKASIYGWTGFVDTLEAAFVSCREMADMGLLPNVCAGEARPLV
ncbi:hypothetical protein CC86DRAFT_431876 [Ophiobolus disseminans]|uniref:PRISE-like Rossmann-fold domain-containing protein n=1 Tax=Ophiobolus disseminans TaxID=1469910 RepID=A0A6A6ZG77_9PLEO|nr:hypothetical protein CC86DRAFT_431876 [Ophiobolus disseminans]